MTRPVALVTGASRGIGRATALALAEAGHDVAVTARTLREGEGRDDSDAGGGRPVPGSLEATAAEIAERGGRALPIVADLTDVASLEAAVARVDSEWGRLDVLVNNAVHTGAGSMVRFLDLPLEQFAVKLQANALAQAAITQAALRVQLRHGGGTVVNVTSFSAYNDPPGPVGRGGWGYAYAGSKAAFHRMAGILAVELADEGIRVFNVDPGHVVTERMAANSATLGLSGHYQGAPPTVPAAAIAWLVTSPEAAVHSGTTVIAQKLALQHGLHPDWRPPRP